MGDELIRLDTTIIGIDSLINKAPTVEEAKVLIMAMQMRLLMSTTAVDNIIEQKIQRQLERIRKEQNDE